MYANVFQKVPNELSPWAKCEYKLPVHEETLASWFICNVFFCSSIVFHLSRKFCCFHFQELNLDPAYRSLHLTELRVGGWALIPIRYIFWTQCFSLSFRLLVRLARLSSTHILAPVPGSFTTPALAAVAMRNPCWTAEVGNLLLATVTTETRPEWCANHLKVRVLFKGI